MDIITISDDEVECVKQVINLAPIIVDLTDDDPSFFENSSEQENEVSNQQENQEGCQQQQHPPHKQQSQSQPPLPPQKRPSQPPPSQRPPSQKPVSPRPPSPKPPSPRPSSQTPSRPSQPQPHPPHPPQPQFLSPKPQFASPQPPSQQRPQSPPLQHQPPSQRVLTDNELMIAKKNLGNEKYKKNQFNDAIRIYREASELAKRLNDKDMSATLHFNLAMTYDRLGSYIQAADECAAAVKLKSDYMKPHLKRAEIYERLHKFDEAVICWDYICETEPSNKEYAIRLNKVREAAIRTRKKDPLELLGLNPRNFTRDDLRKAYKKKALSHHPDKHPDADIVTRRIQEKLFKDASEAHSYVQLRYGYNR